MQTRDWHATETTEGASQGAQLHSNSTTTSGHGTNDDNNDDANSHACKFESC